MSLNKFFINENYKYKRTSTLLNSVLRRFLSSGTNETAAANRHTTRYEDLTRPGLAGQRAREDVAPPAED